MRKKGIPFLMAMCLSSLLLAGSRTNHPQEEYERSIESVVRNKGFYKSGRFEVAANAGVMPYDSLINHYILGGRATWHLSDHYGWEMIDLQFMLPSITNYSKNTVSQQGISNLQTVQLRFLAGSNFLLSPFYGKIRFFGRQTLYLDIYTVAGLGVSKAETIKLSVPGVGGSVSDSVVSSSIIPVVCLGLGFKIFLNRAMGLLIDFRDYIAFSKTYGKNQPKSNFSVFAGLSFFLPVF